MCSLAASPAAFGANALKQGQKLAANSVIIQAAGIFSGHCQNVAGRREMLVQPEKFPQKPFHTIARHRIAHLAGYGHAKTAAGTLGHEDKKHKMGRMPFCALLIAGLIFRMLADTAPGWVFKARQGCLLSRHAAIAKVGKSPAVRAKTAFLLCAVFTAVKTGHPAREQDACGPWRDGGGLPPCRRGWTCAQESRGCGRGGFCWAGRFSS